MESISFRCSSCNQGLKAPADKAGRRVKCTKCGTELTIPKAEPATPEPPPSPAPQEGDKAGYGFLLDPAEAVAKLKEQEKPAKKGDREEPTPEASVETKKKLPKLKRRFRNIQEPANWAKVRDGLAIVQISMFVWAAAFGLQLLVVILGITQGPEYAAVAEHILTIEGQDTGPGERESVNLPGFLVGLISGYNLYYIGKILLILASILGIVQAVIAITGYVRCMPVPDVNGAPGQVRALLWLAGINIFFNVIFKLLPLLGAMNYALVPWFTPELCLIDANADRSLPIHVFWLRSPFFETLLSILVMLTYYAEPVLFAVFVWTIGVAFREPPVEEVGVGVVEITFGVAFTMLAYYLLSITGTSSVLLIVLRLGYGLWVLFTVILIIRFVMAITKTRDMMYQYIEAAREERAAKGLGLSDDEEEEEEEDEDEEEAPRKPARRRRRSFDEDEEEEED